MKIFDNVAQMKLAHLTAGQIVETKGYYTPGDEGGNKYLIETSQVVDNFGDHDLAGTTVAILQHAGVINILNYGALDATDSTAAIQAACDAASAGNLTVTIPPKGTYLLDGRILIANGIKGLIGFGGTIQCVGIGTIEPDYDGFVFQEANDCEISGLRFDANDRFCRLINLENCQRFNIHHNTFTDIKTGSGVALNPVDTGSQESLGHSICNNYFQGSTDIFDIGVAIDFQVYHDYTPEANITDYWLANHDVPVPTYRNRDCEVTGNIINGVRYGIQFNGAEYCNFSDNIITDNTRGLVGGYGGFGNIISANIIRDTVSTAINISFKGTDNTIEGNKIYSNVANGEGMLLNQLGSKRNKWIDNKVRLDSLSDGRYHMYVGIECDDVEIVDNDFWGYSSQGCLTVETAWDDATTENTSRAWSDGTVQSGYASAGMSNILIQGNRFEHLSPTENAINLLQITDNTVDYPLTGVVVKGNITFSSASNLDLYLYEDASGQSSQHSLTDNNFDPSGDSTKISLPRGRAHFDLVANNNILDRGNHTVTFTATDTTPSIALGHIFNTADASVYTDFDDGIDGQEISILAGHAATVSDNANINTSTALNKVLTIGMLYKFKSINGIWHESA